MSRFVQSISLVLLASLLSAGCLAPLSQTMPPPVVTPGPSRGVVLSVDGAGGFQATSAALSQAIQTEKVPLEVQVFEWSHGYGRVLSDQLDSTHAHRQGERLAQTVANIRVACPSGQIFIVGHSAGCAVVLAAADHLTDNSIDRMILLAPSVSTEYDVRPALRCSRDGVDVFCSRRDIAYLGLGVTLIGTADHRWSCPAAGRVGFTPQERCPGDHILFAKLRQHAWDPAVEWTGNRGGHYDGYQPAFLRAYVLPLFAGPAACTPGFVAPVSLGPSIQPNS
jgi:pimeloyl-ACP methyl ester carboxylesterase